MSHRDGPGRRNVPSRRSGQARARPPAGRRRDADPGPRGSTRSRARDLPGKACTSPSSPSSGRPGTRTPGRLLHRAGTGPAARGRQPCRRRAGHGGHAGPVRRWFPRKRRRSWPWTATRSAAGHLAAWTRSGCIRCSPRSARSRSTSSLAGRRGGPVPSSSRPTPSPPRPPRTELRASPFRPGARRYQRFCSRSAKVASSLALTAGWVSASHWRSSLVSRSSRPDSAHRTVASLA